MRHGTVFGKDSSGFEAPVLFSRCCANVARRDLLGFLAPVNFEVLCFGDTLAFAHMVAFTREEYLQLLVERAPYHRKTQYMYVITTAVLMVACITVLVIIIMSCT